MRPPVQCVAFLRRQWPLCRSCPAQGPRVAFLGPVNRSFLRELSVTHTRYSEGPILPKEGPNGREKRQNDEQTRVANLGLMVEHVKTLVPGIMSKSLPKELLSSDILLRLCPTHFAELNSFLPHIRGHVSYYATCKTLQLILTSLVLNPRVRIHIQSIRTTKSSTGLDLQCVFPEATKIFVRWSTCSDGCEHLSAADESDKLNFHLTSEAKLGTHSWSKFDSLKAVGGASALSLKNTIGLLTLGLIGLTKAEKNLERVISGIFIFELSEQNDSIIVHTVEDIVVIERTEREEDKLRVLEF